ncbi:S9 family peptidase [Brevibacillus sp. NRS-1366]|uniref:S9 family peptidase n=1 Tax=Brevibacillus sp. NRS-1366 TaxID=3233899 RepID=UPI003D1F0AFF
MRTVTAQDIYNFQWPSKPTISPNGQLVVYERTIVRQKTDDYETQLWLADVHGHSRRVLTTVGTRNMSPVWSPDGRTIAFLSNRAFGTQLWLLSLDGGEARQVTRFRHGVSSIVWAPDGRFVYGLVPVAERETIEVFEPGLTAKEAEEHAEKESKQWRKRPKRYNRQYYKLDGAGLQRALVRQIVAIDIETGDISQITHGFYDIFEPTVSSDGQHIAFIANQNESEQQHFGGQIYRVPTSGGDVELLYNGLKASYLSYSPDAKQLAFVASNIDHKEMFVIPADGGEARCLSKNFPDTLTDLAFTDMRSLKYTPHPQWSKDSQYVYALSTREGKNEIVRFSLADSDSQAVTVIGGERTIFHFSYDGIETVAVAYSTVHHPGKVAAVKVSQEAMVERKLRTPLEPLSTSSEALFPESEVRLDDCNDELLSELITVEPEAFSYDSEDGWQIQGFVLKPANYEAGKKYPVLLDIHGGPHSMFGFTYFHQMQLFAANGYAVVYSNPRGSSGYGAEFTHAVHGDYGGKDMTDILNGLAEASRRYDFIDDKRVAVNGISYGGFMVNWLVTHTDRFFAAVSEGCISNWISMYGTSDVGPDFLEMEFLGKTDVETLWKFSPLAYVKNVKTPLLLLHAEDDLRCPVEQAEQFYTHIKRQGGEVELLRIPHSSHGLLQIGIPSLRQARLEAMVDFVNTHLPEHTD